MLHLKSIRFYTIIAFALASNTAGAENLSPLNTLEIIGLSGNDATVFQAPQSGNFVQISFSGTDNGASSNDYVADPVWFGQLTPGTVSQQGSFQNAELAISGNGNLFAISQTGSSNSTQGQISGTSNTAVVQQSGTANRAQFMQVGTGNMLSVLQNM